MRVFALLALLLISVALPAPAQYVLPQFTANTGGRPMASGDISHNGSVGQSTAGLVSGGDLQASVGFWGWGVGPVSSVEPGSDQPLPAETHLAQSIPNPYRPPRTTIHFQVGAAGNGGAVSCRLSVYNVQGRLIRTLVSGTRSPGYYTVPWNAEDDTGTPVPSGVYFCTLRAGAYVSTRHIVLLR